MFVRNESFQGFTRSYPVITTLVAIHIILYIWVYFFPFLGGKLVMDWGLGINYLIEMGEYWRLVTPIFLHGSLMHMLFNSFSLVLFGPALESMLGKFRFIAAYFTAGILANIVTLFLEGPMYAHLGASGAIYGLFGLYLYMVLVRKDLIDPGSAQLIITIMVIGVIMTFVNPGINRIAHIFGLISGAAIAPIILLGVTRYGRYNRSSGRGDSGDIGFDPDRWRKRDRNKQRMKVAFICIGALALFLFIIFAIL
ncbi:MULTISPECIES: rhomboid family intramembrane serine protease [Bacillaceae]|uniref:Rhomboid family intramembrane serine protease n=1 Tax=Evansella alkalicola TaxID=745819 RepID=A0ABS6K1J3_9BACI|nr:MULTISPECIES: rhomboid family intramembrane serine protease [Bacillaceae]MBU9723794.1 rhomboid family intramembrane serine protease [Bacillus alkalicola]